MSHRVLSCFLRLSVMLLLVVAVLFPVMRAGAQSLVFTPGVSTVYAGDPTGTLGASSATYIGPLSGLVIIGAYYGNIVYDTAGNLYIFDSTAQVIRVVAASSKPVPALPGVAVQAGYVYTVAGSTGAACAATTNASTGDGCPASQSIIPQNVSSMAVDANGNIFISDQSSNEIRVVYAGGTVPGLMSPVAGDIYSVTPATSYLSQNGSPANIISVDAQDNIYFNAAGFSGLFVVYSGKTPAGNPLGIPSGTAAGEVYAFPNQSCSYPDPNSCGDGGSFTQAGFQTDIISQDPSGNYYINDAGNSRVRAVYVAGSLPGISGPTVGDIYTVAGGGNSPLNSQGDTIVSPLGISQATTIGISSGIFNQPITFDAAGDFYFTNGNYITFKVNAAGNMILVFGNGEGFFFGTQVTCPSAIDIYGDGCPASEAIIDYPLQNAVDPNGDLLLMDYEFADEVGSVPANSTMLIREAAGAASAVNFLGTAGFPTLNEDILISNAGTQPLQLSGLNFTGQFAQIPDGAGNDCIASTNLAPGMTCAITIESTATAPGMYNGSLKAASNSPNATGGYNTVAINGTIVQATTSTTLSASPAFPTVINTGQAVTFTVNVLPQFGDALVPTGTVTLLSGSTEVGTGTLTNGSTTVQVSNLPTGSLQITAQYNGDTNFSGSTSIYVPVSVATASSPVAEVVLSASPTIATAGQSITLTATVTTLSGTPITSGTVTFEDGANSLGAAVAVNSSGTATFTTTTLPVGGNPLVALFNGATGYGANTSGPVDVTVNGGGQLAFTPGVLTTDAGIPSGPGYSGDGGPASQAALNSPSGVATDNFGNVYILDKNNGVVRVIASTSGMVPGIPNTKARNIYTFAGGGTCNPAPCGDGGPAIQAGLATPTAIATDPLGNVYIADDNGGVVRKVNSQGVIQTIAGNASSGPGYSGDNGPATSAQFAANAIYVDNAGNLYISDGGGYNNTLGNAVINELARRVDGLTGIITTVAGTTANAGVGSYNGNQLNNCTQAPCGDGGLATNAFLSNPSGVAVDPAGNIFISDSSDSVIRRVDAKTGVITTVAGQYFQYGFSGDGGPATSALLSYPGNVEVDNAGNLYIGDNGRVRQVNVQTGVINTIVGGGSCTALCGNGGLATNGSFNSTPNVGLDSSGNLYLADNSDNFVFEVPVTTTAIDFGSQTDGSTSTQLFTVTNIGAQPLDFTGITVANTSPTPGPSPSDFSQQPSGGTDCSSDISLAAGATCNIEVQWFPTITTAERATLTIASNSLNATSGNNVITANGAGMGSIGSTSQTITFPALPASVAYGASVPLTATANSGLAVSYRISGPGTVDATGTAFTVTGTGTITVTAYQFGNSQYAAATPVPQTTVSSGGATLTVAANNLSVPQGSAIPTLTYNISGLENGDTTSGMPALTTAATQNSPIGNYPISIAQGSLTAPAAYQINFVPGTLYITGSGRQTVTFAPLSAVTYGVKPITLSATASSKDAVTFTVASGPGYITNGNTLNVTGAGQIVVNANQYGDGTYAAAPVISQALTVNPAPLTITANSLTIVQGQAIPALTGYTVNTAQLVNGDTQAVLTGIPAETTTTTQGSTPGNYPINITAGTLTAANYSFSFVAGTLTIGTGQSQTITFTALPNVVYGVMPITLTAKSSAGLGITYIVAAGPATVVGSTLTISGVGTVTVTATQAGAGQYGPATPVSQTFTVAPAVLTLTANNAARVNDTQNPAFTYTLTGFVNGDTQGTATSGQPNITTTATPGSPVGTYPIVPAASITTAVYGTQVYLSAANYTFLPINGTLTITSGGPVSNFTLSATPQQLQVVTGDSVQTTITLTPQNYYQGLVTLSCASLPANVQCVFSPATVSPDGTATQQTTTMTITTNSAATVIAKSTSNGRTHIEVAMLYLPGALAGLLLVFRRRKFLNSAGAQQPIILAVLLAAFMGLAACGGKSTSSSSSSTAAPGTYTITVTAKGQDGTTNTIPVSIKVL